MTIATIDFVKMNGAGNDFVVIDCFDREVRLSGEQIAALCDRRRGIGADGVLLLLPHAEHDFRMRYYNRDGGEAEMCGNGARCLAHFAACRGLGHPAGAGRELRFESAAGDIHARVTGDRVAIGMTDAGDRSVNISLQVEKEKEIVHVINTGVPHAVIQAADVNRLSDDYIDRRGRAIRSHPTFEPAGCNVNFASVAGNTIAVRTYERGVEQETLACGTGAVAAAIIFEHLGLARVPVSVITRGGDRLQVFFTPTDAGATQVTLEGPAQVNFTGSITI